MFPVQLAGVELLIGSVFDNDISPSCVSSP